MSGHLVIAGTGRAGTTFLVRWLGACGLDVGEWGPDAYDEAARAGLERSLLTPGPDPLPHVVKDPWLWAYCNDVDPTTIDLLVVPVRDSLEAAAESRVRVEREAQAATHPGRTVGVTDFTPGGLLVPLDAAWQAQVLAVGLHRLLAWAALHEVPTCLLSYPLLATDVEHLLRSPLGEMVDYEIGRKAHAAVVASGPGESC